MHSSHDFQISPSTLTPGYRWQRFQRRAFDGPVCAWPTSQGKLFWTSRSERATSSSTHHLPHADHWATDGYQLAGQHLNTFLTYPNYDIFRTHFLRQSHSPFLFPCLLLETRIGYNNDSCYGHTAFNSLPQARGQRFEILAPQPVRCRSWMRRRPDHDCHSMYPLWRPDSFRVAASFLKLTLVSWHRAPGIIDRCQSLWTTTHSRNRILKILHAELKSTWSTPRLVAIVMAKGKPSDLWG